MDRHRIDPRFQTEIEFDLPKGYLDETGMLHRHGVMRLATAADEILPLRDPRVQQNQAYLAIIVLARVIVKLGDAADDRHRRHRGAVRVGSRLSAAASTSSSTRPREPQAASPCRRARTVARRRGCPSWGKHEGLSRGRLYEEMAFIAAPFPLEQRNADAIEHARTPALVPRDLRASTARSTARRDDPFAGL